MARKGKAFTFWLRQEFQEHADALRYIEMRMNADGPHRFTLREIIVDALLARAGHTPEMYHRGDQTYLENFANEVRVMLADFGDNLRREMQAGVLVANNEDNNEADSLGEWGGNFLDSIDLGASEDE